MKISVLWPFFYQKPNEDEVQPASEFRWICYDSLRLLEMCYLCSNHRNQAVSSKFGTEKKKMAENLILIFFEKFVVHDGGFEGEKLNKIEAGFQIKK